MQGKPLFWDIKASPLQKGTRHWAVTGMGHWLPGSGSHLSKLAAVGAVLCSTPISMETQPGGLIQVFHLGSSHMVLGLPGSDQRGQQLGQCWMGLQVRVQGGQPSPWHRDQTRDQLCLSAWKNPGQAAPCLGGSPITPSESHCSLALLLPISGTPQHPCLWRHSTAWYGMLPASGTFPTLTICPMVRGLPPSHASAPRPCPHCLPCAAAPGHKA